MKKKWQVNKSRIAREAGLAGRFLTAETLLSCPNNVLPTDYIWVLAERYATGGRDRSFAFDLLAGVLKRQGTLNHLIEVFSGKTIRQVQPVVGTILQIGLEQMLFEDSVADYAAVDSSCELARGYLGSRPAGFVNAVLRNIQRGIRSRETAIVAENALRVLPMQMDRGVEFDRAIFPLPVDSPAHLAKAYSYPLWLVERWRKRWGPAELKAIFAAGNARPTLIIRPNVLRTTVEGLAKLLEEESCRVRVLPEEGAIVLLEHPPLTELEAFSKGLFQVQDLTAMAPARALELKPGMKILDLCAGLGTKTTQLAEMTGDQAEIVATDITASKLEKLVQNAQRLGLKSIKTVPLETPGDGYDVVVLDVPCTNTGVFDRRPEARWRIKESDFTTFPRQSLELLKKATELVKPGGRIAFSTCSIDEEENGAVIREFCRQEKWQIESEHVQLPKIDPETGRVVQTGGYRAGIRES